MSRDRHLRPFTTIIPVGSPKLRNQRIALRDKRTREIEAEQRTPFVLQDEHNMRITRHSPLATIQGHEYMNLCETERWYTAFATKDHEDGSRPFWDRDFVFCAGYLSSRFPARIAEVAGTRKES